MGGGGVGCALPLFSLDFLFSIFSLCDPVSAVLHIQQHDRSGSLPGHPQLAALELGLGIRRPILTHGHRSVVAFVHALAVRLQLFHRKGVVLTGHISIIHTVYLLVDGQGGGVLVGDLDDHGAGEQVSQVVQRGAC